MSTPTLPAGMRPLVSGYAFQAPGGVMATEVAGGAARYALDWDRGTQRFNVSMLLARLEFSVWTAFYHHVVKKGAISFTMPLDSGYGLTAHLVNIMPGSYEVASLDAYRALVSFSVEAESQVYQLSETEGAALVDMYALYGAGTPALLSRLATFALSDSLVLDF